jgi:hypothetical protein
MSFFTKEKRKDRRSIFPSTIEYTVGPHSGDESFKCVTVNISNSGLCFYTPNPLSEGQEILIRSDLPVSYRKATVRWIKRLNDEAYKTGLMFVP